MDEVERNNYGDQDGQEPIYQSEAVQTRQLDFFGQPIDSQIYVPLPEEQFYYHDLLPADQAQGNNGCPSFDYGSVFNGHGPNNGSMGQNCGPYVSGPPPGFHSQLPMEYCQMMPPHPMDTRFNIATPWVDFPQQMAPGPPPPYFVGPPVEMLPFNQSVPTPMGIPQMWNRFEAPKPPQGMRISRQESSDDPWWRSRPVPLHENWDSTMARLGNFGGGYGGRALEIMPSEERFQNQLKIFTQLPMDVHRKIQTMPGCEITDYFEVTVVRFRLQNIVDSNPCHVVFTKKPETGQCWLMAFSITDRYRTVIKFNRLLTAHLKVKVNGKTAVEIQPSKVAQSVEGEFYMFNFMLATEAQKFIDVLDIARSQVWNHDQVDHHAFGQKMITNESQGYRFGRSDFKMSAPYPSSSSGALDFYHTKRSYRSIPKYVRDNILDSPTFRGSLQEKLWPQYCGGKQYENGPGTPDQHQNEEELKFVKFSSSATLFIKAGNDYASLGSGELSIVYHENSYDELVFVGPKKDVICHHHIYQWHKTHLRKGDNNFSCYWAAATHLNNSPSEFPLMRELKMEVDSEETLLDFCKTFTEGIKKGGELANTCN